MLRVKLEGSNRAYVGEYSEDSVMGLARVLIAAGYPDQPFECYRGDMLCLKFRSLAWAATRTIREEPALRVEKYKKFEGKNSFHGLTTDTYGLTTDTVTPKMIPEPPLTVSPQTL